MQLLNPIYPGTRLPIFSNNKGTLKLLDFSYFVIMCLLKKFSKFFAKIDEVYKENLVLKRP